VYTDPPVEQVYSRQSGVLEDQVPVYVKPGVLPPIWTAVAWVGPIHQEYEPVPEHPDPAVALVIVMVKDSPVGTKTTDCPRVPGLSCASRRTGVIAVVTDSSARMRYMALDVFFIV
jgi:hypothetical protein